METSVHKEKLITLCHRGRKEGMEAYGKTIPVHGKPWQQTVVWQRREEQKTLDLWPEAFRITSSGASPCRCKSKRFLDPGITSLLSCEANYSNGSKFPRSRSHNSPQEERAAEEEGGRRRGYGKSNTEHSRPS